MKKTAIVLSLAALACNLYAFDSAAPLAVQGGVREYTKTTYTITEKFGDYYRSPAAKYVHVLDVNGRETETSEYTNKDVLVDKVTYAYDDAGRLTTTTCTDADGKVSWKIVTTYDASGNKVDESQYNASDVLTHKSIWKHTGKQSEESYYNAEGTLLGKTITKFDDQDREIEIYQYAAEGYLEEKRTIAYNDAGKLSEITYTNGDDVQTKKLVYRFDANYAITEEQAYNAANKLTIRIIYKYDDAGNISRTTTYSVAEKFGTTVNELIDIKDYTFSNTVTTTPAARTMSSSSLGTANAK